MFDNSIMYNLRNPAFTEDIGVSMMKQMFPIPDSNMLAGTRPALLNGQLNMDTFNSIKEQQTKKDKGILKKILIGAGIAAAAFAGWKYGGKAWDVIKGLFHKK